MAISSIMFVCLGNICRSPLAEGVFRHEVESRGFGDRFVIESAGTGGWHVGNGPDMRAINTALDHDIDISQQTCRQLNRADFQAFDLFLCMDDDNIADCKAIAGRDYDDKIMLFAEYGGLGKVEIADPYYGGHDGFEAAYQMIKAASAGVIARIAS